MASDRSASASGTHDLDRLQWGDLRDWAQLVRLPTVFTLFSNCIAASIVAGAMLSPLSGFLPTLCASLCAYWAGMILNDVVDLEDDRRYRPSRPLAAGRISPIIAGHVATGMLLLCPLLILITTSLHDVQPLWMGAAFLCAVLLSLSVRAYDSWIKRTLLGPLLMGLCRALNVLMVGCTMFALSDLTQLPLSLPGFAAAVGLYIVGVTTFARQEEQQEAGKLGLGFGLVLEAAGLILLGCLPLLEPSTRQWGLDPYRGYPLLIGLIGVTVLNRGLAGFLHPVPRKVQLAIKHALLTLILLDASLALMWAGPWYGGLVVMLLIPAMLSAVRIRTT